MRYVSKSDRFSIYFQTFPHLMGEVLLVMGVIMTIIAFPQWQVIFSFVFLVVGSFIVKNKLDKMRHGTQILMFGDQTIAVISEIEDSIWEHNGRKVRKYNFRYTINGNQFSYKYRSAYKRELAIGNKFPIFYLKDDPSKAIIPQLYSVYIYK